MHDWSTRISQIPHSSEATRIEIPISSKVKLIYLYSLLCNESHYHTHRLINYGLEKKWLRVRVASRDENFAIYLFR